MRESRVEEQDTVEKAPVKRRKSQRMTRIVYETTEYSIFEHIIEESRKAVLVVKGGAEAQEVASAPDAEDRGAELGVASREKQRERKKRGKVERVMTEVSKEVEEDLEAGLEAELEAELEAGLEAESSFMDIELATYTSSNPASKGVRWRW